jgi:transcriptional regulator GlxA family with amidase domain
MPDFTVLVHPNAYAASVAITMDVLHAAELLASRFQLPKPSWRIVSPEGGTVALSGGLQLMTRRMAVGAKKAGSKDNSIWVVPGLGIANPTELPERLASKSAQRAALALKRHFTAGGHVAASCSAVFLLQAAGLLLGRRVTTSWWLAQELRRVEPTCVVDADRMVIRDGPLTTAGAALAQSDLMLSLLRQRFGNALAEMVGKVLLLDGRQVQSTYVIPALQAAGNTLIERLIESINQKIESALSDTLSVATLAKEFAMSQRTLARKVQAATGQGPLALIQSVRLNRARTLIENSRLSIEQVAQQVGYEDATALRRLMRKASGVNPSRFRRLS